MNRQDILLQFKIQISAVAIFRFLKVIYKSLVQGEQLSNPFKKMIKLSYGKVNCAQSSHSWAHCIGSPLGYGLGCSDSIENQTVARSVAGQE